MMRLVIVLLAFSMSTSLVIKGFKSSIKTAKRTLNMSNKRLTDLCQVSKEACEAVSPMLQAFYSQIRIAAGDDSTAKLKSDSTFFSIADGIVQHMFIEHLFAGDKFGQIVGEEDDTKVNILEAPYYVDDLIVPEEFNGLIAETLQKVKSLANRIDPSLYQDITVFVDPIDGTREFATGKGECVTILIGYNDKAGVPVAGITYRPLTSPPTWAAGAKQEGCVMGHLDMAPTPNSKGILITDGKVSKFIEELIKEAGLNKVNSLASGNRALMLIEGKAGCYIRDTGGFAKWDTSGPQAVIEAYGGTMSKLPGFLKSKALESYTHLKTDVNLDFQKDSIKLTLSNAKDKAAFKALPTAYKATTITATVDMLKEYSCLLGLVALDKSNLDPKNVDHLHTSMLKVLENHKPTYT